MNTTYLRDIEYGTHERHRLDIIIPENVVKPEGVLLFLHGGGWHKGDKADSRDALKALADLGFISATMNYRFVTDELNIFDELDDITQALKAIKSTCKEYGYDIKRLVLSGASAGSQLALLYAYTKRAEAPITPMAACVYCPPVSFFKEDFLSFFKGDLEEWKYDLLSKCCGYKYTKETLYEDKIQAALKKISPIEYVSDDCVPTFIFHGKNDELIPFEHVEEFIEKLNENNVENKIIVFENSGHELDNDPEEWEQSQFMIFLCLRKYL